MKALYQKLYFIRGIQDLGDEERKFCIHRYFGKDILIDRIGVNSIDENKPPLQIINSWTNDETTINNIFFTGGSKTYELY